MIIRNLSKKLIQKFSSNIPREFAYVNNSTERHLWEYENYTIQYGIQDDYEIFKQIGKGKYSEVFNGINVVDSQRVIIKMLKPNQPKKHQREVLVLNRLKDHPKITQFKEAVIDRVCSTKSLIFEEFEGVELKSQYDKLTLDIIKNIIKQILQGLLYAHQNGIFHRDIKPQNIIIDKKLENIKIIDWGLAEFYHPEKDYNVRVASRYFKAPELLLDYRLYNYSLDTWSLGVLLAGMIFQQEPFIAGKNNDDQFIQTVKLLGSYDLELYMKKYDIALPSRYEGRLAKYSKKPFDRFINEKNQKLCTVEIIELLEQMIIYDHVLRPTIPELLKFFD